MRDSKGKFIKGQSPWNRGKKGWVNQGSFVNGHGVSREVREKIRLAKLGKPSPMKGKHQTKEANEKNRIAHLGKSTGSGQNHWNWKGGITPLRKKLYFSKEYILWRTAVFMRDDYICKECGQKGGELQADHIKPWALYPELRFAIDNGRTLCVSCHRQTDTWGVRPKTSANLLFYE